MRSLHPGLAGALVGATAFLAQLLMPVGPALAQADPVWDFIIRADSLASAGGDDALAPYVRDRGVLVGAAVDQLLDVGFEVGEAAEASDASGAGDSEAEAENVDFAERLARIHAELTGSAIPLELVSVHRAWTREQRGIRSEALAKEAEATELRGAGDYGAAVLALESARALYEQIGDARSVAVVWGSLGVVHWYRGDMETVIVSYEQALTARRAVEDNILVGRTLNGLGSANYRSGQLDAAINYYDQAKEIREATGDLAGLGSTLTYLGNCYLDLGELGSARGYYEAALPVLEATGRQVQYLELLNGLGNLEAQLGNREREELRCREAVALANEIGDPREAMFVLTLGFAR